MDNGQKGFHIFFNVTRSCSSCNEWLYGQWSEGFPHFVLMTQWVTYFVMNSYMGNGQKGFLILY